MSNGKDDVIYCNQCKNKTRHICEHTVSRTGTDGSVDWTKTADVLICGGCDHITLKSQTHFSEYQYHPGDLDLDPEYLPQPMFRIEPEWCISLSDETIRAVLKELYAAFNSGLVFLSAVGARTVLDLVLTKSIGDIGSFEKKLDTFESEDYVTSKEKAQLKVLVEAGGAAAHRGHALQKTELSTIIDILESLLHKLYVQPIKTDQLSHAAGNINIPPRRRRSE